MEFLNTDPPQAMLTAEEARRLAARNEDKKDVNYTLTLRRLMRIIESESKLGRTLLEFQAPSFVLDGSLADPILLARQLKARLKQLGYKVKRVEEHITIEW